MPKLSLKKIEQFEPGDVILLDSGKSIYQVRNAVISGGQARLSLSAVGQDFLHSSTADCTRNLGTKLLFFDAGLRQNVNPEDLQPGDFVAAFSKLFPNRNPEMIVSLKKDNYFESRLEIETTRTTVYRKLDDPLIRILPLLSIPPELKTVSQLEIGQEINILIPPPFNSSRQGRVIGVSSVGDQQHVLTLESSKDESGIAARARFLISSNHYVELLPDLVPSPVRRSIPKGHLNVEMFL